MPEDPRVIRSKDLKLCSKCLLASDISSVLRECEESQQGGWFEVVTLGDSCEECRALEGIRFSRQDLAKLIPDDERVLVPECWCVLVYYFPDHGKATPVPKRRHVHLSDLKRKEDGTYDLSGLRKCQIADLIWDENTCEEGIK